jgi:hypothetical protein
VIAHNKMIDTVVFGEDGNGGLRGEIESFNSFKTRVYQTITVTLFSISVIGFLAFGYIRTFFEQVAKHVYGVH